MSEWPALRIIIPYYNTKEYTDELLKKLDPQITPDVDVLLIDDGSDEPYKTDYQWCMIIRCDENHGQAHARNIGLDYSGLHDYIQFIDSDDMVADDFIKNLLEVIHGGRPEVIEYSWKSLNNSGAQFDFKIKEHQRNTNPSACTRCFRRDFIGDHRFNENKDACEDEEFTRKLFYGRQVYTFITIPEYMYFYRTDVSGSNVKSYKAGQKRTHRVVYHYNRVEYNPALLEEIKREDIFNEVILLTNENNMPELKEYCQVLKPCKIWTHALRGEPLSSVEIIPLPVKKDILLYVGSLHTIGGIETFIYHFARVMSRSYTVGLVIKTIPPEQSNRIGQVIPIFHYNPQTRYICDSLIALRILDTIPGNIEYEKSIRTVHACRTNPQWHIPQDTDYIVNVSQASKDSFGEEAENAIVIHNPITKSNTRPLMLVSATRIPAPDKGINVQRMIRLADMLETANIPFIWLNFSDGVANHKKIINVGIQTDIQAYIAKADYLVQLSDSEAWSYSMLEALTNNVPVICCPFPSAAEMQIIDGKNGYIVPFDMNFDVRKLLNIPQFDYEYENPVIRAQWKQIFDKKLKRKKRKLITVEVTKDYQDLKLKRFVKRGEILTVTPDRAKELRNGGVI